MKTKIKMFLRPRKTKLKHVIYNNPIGVLPLFLMFGINIDFRKSCFKERLVRVTKILAILLWISIFVISLSLFSLIISSSWEMGKLLVLTNFRLYSAFCLWVIIFFSQRKIKAMIKQLTRLGNSLEAAPPKIFNYFCFFYVSLCFFISSIVPFYPYNEARITSFFRMISFGYLNLRGDAVFYAGCFYSIFILAPLSAFYNIFIALYITVCKYLHIILRTYEAKAAKLSYEMLSEAALFESYNCYIEINSALQSVEESLSLAVTTVFFAKIVGVFASVIVMINKLDSLYAEVGYQIFDCVYNLVPFLLIMILGSGVNTADKQVKQTNRNYIYLLISYNQNLRSDLVLAFLNLNSSPPFSLSGWGFFDFDKSFILAAFGGFFTYLLLVIQLK